MRSLEMDYLTESLIKALNSFRGDYLELHRREWGKLLDPGLRVSYRLRLGDKSNYLEVERLDYRYGYLRLKKQDCSIEGLIIYGQYKLFFKPILISDKCSGKELKEAGE